MIPIHETKTASYHLGELYGIMGSCYLKGSAMLNQLPCGESVQSQSKKEVTGKLQVVKVTQL